MIKTLLKLLFTALFLFFTSIALAQTGTMPGEDGKTKPDDKSNDGSSSFKVGINYSSNNVFMGRSDTVRTPTIIPTIKYTLKSGIYFSGAIDFIPNRKKKKLDGGDLTAGYDFDITDDLSGGVSLAKMFYSATSTQIGSAVRETFNGNLTYDIGTVISPSISFDYNLNKQGIGNDVFANAGLTHDFIVVGVFADADIFIASPTILVNTGTENFYDAYLTQKKLKNVKREAKLNAVLNQYISELSQFKLLDYELSAPLEYKNGKFIFTFTPTYAIVKNELPKQIETKISSAGSVFYFETGVALKF